MTERLLSYRNVFPSRSFRSITILHQSRHELNPFIKTLLQLNGKFNHKLLPRIGHKTLFGPFSLQVTTICNGPLVPEEKHEVDIEDVVYTPIIRR